MRPTRLPGHLLPRKFFEDTPERVAPRLLGKLLMRRTRAGVVAGRIVEVEAYLGPHHATADAAAHSYRGPTPRNQVLFGPAGHAYVYAIYGRYFCMNITCEPEGRAGCLLLRALEPVMGLEAMAWNRGLAAGRDLPLFAQKARKGPGTGERLGREHFRKDEALAEKMRRALTSGPSRLCQALEITRAAHNGVDLLDARSALQVRDDGFGARSVLVTARIGIRHAAELPLRFFLAEQACVSGPRKMQESAAVLREESLRLDSFVGAGMDSMVKAQRAMRVKG
jgi:DNA-3-methyladenine glycosylase